MGISVSELRANIYRLLDEVLVTGTPLEVDRNGRKLLIVVPEVPGRLSKLVRRPNVVVGDSEDLVHLDWSASAEPTLRPHTPSNAPGGPLSRAAFDAAEVQQRQPPEPEEP